MSSYNSQTVKFKFVGTANRGYNLSLDEFKLYNNNFIIFFKEEEPSNSTPLTSLSEVTPTLKVYPNPFINQLQVETSLPNVQGYRLLNLHGQVVKTGSLSSNSTTLNFYELPVGTYFITLYNEETQLVQKVIKQ